MSMRTLETVILHAAKSAFNNRGLCLKDIQEWSSGEIKPQDGEVTLRIDDPGVWVTIKVNHDKRKVK